MPVVVFLLLTLAPVFGWNQEPDPNVNSRYTIEAVEFPSKFQRKLSAPVRAEMDKLIGGKFSQEMVDRISKRIRHELRGYQVMQKITKGAKPESLKLVYEVIRARRQQDVVLPKLVYHSRENFSFGGDADFRSGNHEFRLGLLTDNDRQVDRYSGIRGGYRRYFADGRVTAGFQVASWRSQWNPAVEAALQQPQNDTYGIYRTRLHVEPGVGVELIPGVNLYAGFAINRFQTQFPVARFESSNALVSSLRLERRWEPSNLGRHDVEAGYTLRAASKSMGSDFSYTRHSFEARYGFKLRADEIGAEFTAGYIAGRAPLFDRFILGNSTTLRGYNKYDVAPLGGSRMAHGSLDYRHKWVRVVYDTGTVHDRSTGGKVLHSLAGGVTVGSGKDTYSLLVAFPLKEGRAEPIFILGMNF